jgi:hypothetical protein
MENEKYTQDQLIEFLNEGHKKNHHCFVLIYLVGCGPCNMTKPEWKKVANSFGYRDDNKGLVMVHIDQNNLDKIHPVVGNYPISGYPTMLHVHGNKIIPYEESHIKNKNRTAESFKEWINQYVKMTGVNNNNNNNNSRESKMESLRRPLLSMSMSRSSRFPGRSRSSSSKHSKKHRRRHRQTGGKWTLKYKKSINCKRPKGFSQRQHCKYGRKKVRFI